MKHPTFFSIILLLLYYAQEPTKIELTVDTEYLVRVLDYFDGDMRKVLGVLVRSPQTKVEISPPAKGSDPKLTPEDQLLRALYSYKSPEDYLNQASWLKISKTDKVSKIWYLILAELSRFCAFVVQHVI